MYLNYKLSRPGADLVQHCLFVDITHIEGEITLLLCNNDFTISYDKKEFIAFSSMSKDELEKNQKIILFAYVYLYDKLNEAIENSESKKTLDDIKERILRIREFLNHITKYIDDYDNLLKKYKDV